MLGSIFIPTLAFAQAAPTSTIQALLDQIKTLQAQLQQLEQQRKALIEQQQTNVTTLIQTLKEGDVGENVRILQRLLAQDQSIYPEGRVTGFFGKLTAKAVKRFQKKHGIEQVGTVGPKTLKKLNEIFGRFGTSSISHRDDDDDDDGHDHGKVAICHTPPGNPANKQTLVVSKSALNAHLAHGDTRGPCVGQTMPIDTTAPLISNPLATNITFNSVMIAWNTNEGATSQVEYGTTTSYGATTTLNSSLVTSHSMAITDLATSTTYHFRVLSKDAAGNLAISGDFTFTTATPDITPPIISGVSALPAALTATVYWSTNEPATSKVYYSTTSPVALGTAPLVSNNAFVTIHALGLSGLSTSTTYYLVIESKDAANNMATTTASFTTTS